jgi:phosphoglycolate phosphatase
VIENNSSRLAILFDIDGTLIDSAGAGGRALLTALQHEFGVPRALAVPLHGRTDLGIMSELLAANHVSVTEENLARLTERYLELLPAELAARSGRILPGVLPLLESLKADCGCCLGLLTGNTPRSARGKLEHFGLWDFFKFGVFGDVAHHRPELSPLALAAIEQHGCSGQSAARVPVVIGDTPLDVELACVMGARCLAVCTGGFAESELTAAGATRVVADLSTTEEILDWLFT